MVERVRPPRIKCPNCGELMHGIRGSFRARCSRCGFKDSCCY